MQVINTLLFYILFCSAVLIYGVGMLPVAEMSLSRRKFFLTALKSFFCVIITVVLTYLIKKLLLLPLKLDDLYPLVALVIFISVGVFLEIIIQITARKSGAEFTLPYLTIILALSEGSGLLDSLAISVAILASYYVLVPILQAFCNRTALLKSTDSFRQKISLFLCMVVFMLALYSLNASWINITLWN